MNSVETSKKIFKNCTPLAWSQCWNPTIYGRTDKSDEIRMNWRKRLDQVLAQLCATLSRNITPYLCYPIDEHHTLFVLPYRGTPHPICATLSRNTTPYLCYLIEEHHTLFVPPYRRRPRPICATLSRNTTPYLVTKLLPAHVKSQSRKKTHYTSNTKAFIPHWIRHTLANVSTSNHMFGRAT